MKKALTCVYVVMSLAAIAQPKNAGVSISKNKFLDIPYATASEAQRLDVYPPEQGDGPFPAILSFRLMSKKSG